MFRGIKTPCTSRQCFVVAYPEAVKRMGPLHRDDVCGPIYSVFFLVTPVTKVNGTVQIYQDSQKWERNWRLSLEDVLKKAERDTGITPVPTLMEGECYDIVVFDGRLLHQSVYNFTRDVRIVFAFSLFDAEKYPNYLASVGA